MLQLRSIAAVPWLCLGLCGPALLDAQEMDPDRLRRQCQRVHPIRDQAIVYGRVLDARTSTPLPGGTVRLQWRLADDSTHGTPRIVETHAADGTFVFCDVPQRTRLTAWAEALGATSTVQDFWLEAGATHLEDLSVRFARTEGGVAGRVIDGISETPISGAVVRVGTAGQSDITDHDGVFRIMDVRADSATVEIEHIGYALVTVGTEILPGETTYVNVRLDPSPIALEPLEVEVTRRPVWLEARGFYARQDNGMGYYVSPEEIARQPFRPFSEVLRTVPGVTMVRRCTPRCEYLIRMSTSIGSGCPPTIYVDGREMRFRAGVELDAIVPGNDLFAVEVYRGISQTPAEFYGRCGSIVIWSRRGAG